MSILETTGKVMDVAAMEQAKDIAASEEVGIYGLLREKKYIKRRDLVKSIHHRELPFPEPYQVAAHKLNVPWTVTNKAVMVQTAGCNLDCSYCHSRGTEVLMSDWSAKPIEDVEVGDSVWSIDPNSEGHPKVAIATVTDTMSRMAKLETIHFDGDIVQSTKDHRYWRVAGGQGNSWTSVRYLRQGHKVRGWDLICSKETEAFMRGWISGLSEADGTLFINNGTGYPRLQWRLALADVEILDRAEKYLEALGIRHNKRREFKASDSGFATRKPMYCIEISSHCNVCAFMDLNNHNEKEGNEFKAGWLGGFFSGDGGFNDSLRFYQNRGATLNKCVAYLRHLDFDITLEGRYGDCMSVRMLGGQEHHTRFLALCRPAGEKSRFVDGAAARGTRTVTLNTAETDSNATEEGAVYNITTTTGTYYLANGVLSKNCFTGESVVVSATADDLWHDYWDLYCQKAENPSPIFRVSGGEPFLQQDFTADVARTMGSRRRYIEGLHVGSTGVYIWVDTNLTIKPSNYLLNSLNGDRIGVCGCWKPVSAPEKYETQLQVATQLLDAGVDTYFYYPASLDEEDKELLLDAEWDCQWSDIACRWSAEFLSHLHSASKNLGKYYASRLNPISIHYDYETVGGSEVFTAASAIKRDFFLRLQKKFIVMELGEEYWWMPDYMIDIRNGTSQ